VQPLAIFTTIKTVELTSSEVFFLKPLKDSHDLTNFFAISITLLLCRKIYRLNFLPFSLSELRCKSVGQFNIVFVPWVGLSQVFNCREELENR
jgi:hypothetical protein